MIAGVATSSELNRDPTRFVRTLAIITTCALLPLVVVGTGVTTKHAGMAFPDWPTSNGSIVNPEGWTQNEKTLFEHGHRLLGWAVGILALTQAWACFKHGGGLRFFGFATLIAIIIQGVLGGVRVKLDSRFLAMIHGIWAQVCFALACAVILRSSMGWTDMHSFIQGRGIPFFRKLIAVGLVAAFLQLVFGAAYRHFGSTHALISHLLGAAVVIGLLGWISMWVIEQYAGSPLLLRLGRWLAALIGLQLMLGGFAFLVVVMEADLGTTLRWLVPAGHAAVGALLFGCLTSLYFGALRFLSALDSSEQKIEAVSAGAS
ncbi:MAG: COX15/CtaA family protein [Planctomycetes bacterium]|nr:COX15/CtaA family protein [Planctomycetota bacterium]MBI3833313.1 COX15/CtaA family protein [Planctomycetota bacterium]